MYYADVAICFHQAELTVINGRHWADANITCGQGYDKFACPFLYN
jgi:hypothetical protein